MFFYLVFDIITAMKENTKDKIYTVFTVVVILLILAVGIFNWLPSLRRLSSLKEKDAAVEAERAEVKKRIQETDEKAKRFDRDPEQVEAVARQDHRIRQDEIVFDFSAK
jgi:cell division protein FtsB